MSYVFAFAVVLVALGCAILSSVFTPDTILRGTTDMFTNKHPLIKKMLENKKKAPLADCTACDRSRATRKPTELEQDVFRAFMHANGTPPNDIAMRHYTTTSGEEGSKERKFESLLKRMRSDMGENEDEDEDA